MNCPPRSDLKPGDPNILHEPLIEEENNILAHKARSYEAICNQLFGNSSFSTTIEPIKHDFNG